MIGVSEVQLGEPVWAGAVVRHPATEAVDVAAGRPADFTLQVGKRRGRSPVKARPLLAVPRLEFHAVGKARKGRVLLEVVELPIGAQRELLGIHRRQGAECTEDEEYAEEESHRHGRLHRMMATWPVSGAIGRSASLSSMT